MIFFGVKSWFFTRNTPKIFVPPSARRNLFKCATPLTLNPGSAPERGHKTSLTPSLFSSSCSKPGKWTIMYLCVRFIHFGIGSWNCSDSEVFLFFSVRFWNCSDSEVFWNCSDSEVFLFYSPCIIIFIFFQISVNSKMWTSNSSNRNIYVLSEWKRTITLWTGWIIVNIPVYQTFLTIMNKEFYFLENAYVD